MKILEPVASSRPELLKHLGTDADSGNACSQFDIQKVVKEQPAAAKLLHKNCFVAMSGLDDITLDDLHTLPKEAQEAAPVGRIIENMEGEGHFDKLEEKEWNKLMTSAPFCRAASSEVLHKNAKLIEKLTGTCYSALSIELEDKEIQAIKPTTIGQASDDKVAKDIVKYTVPQISALGENVRKVGSLNVLSTEQVAAIQAPAMQRVTPKALGDLDVAHLKAIPPAVFGVITFDQLLSVPQASILGMTPEQAQNLGKFVTDKTQDPHRLFNAELHSKLSAELKKIIAVSSDASIVRSSVVSIAVAVIVALFLA